MRLRDLSGRLVKIQEDERKAISRELHDELGQQVTAINLDLKMAKRESDNDKMAGRIERAISVGEELLMTLHDFATRVRPVELEDLGLHDAVESHLELFSQRSGIKYTLHSDVKELKLWPEVAGNVFRLVQESLNNVFKHANATEVVVSILVTEAEISSHDGQLVVRIQDNGVGATHEPGFAGKSGPANGKGPRLGILGMRERVELLGGEMNFDSSEKTGTAVEFVIPKRVVEDER
jgi:signal transduction histidine kinase